MGDSTIEELDERVIKLNELITDARERLHTNPDLRSSLIQELNILLTIDSAIHEKRAEFVEYQRSVDILNGL